MDTKPRILPLVWLLIFLLLQAGLHKFLPIAQLFEKPVSYTGILLLFLGIFIMVSGARAFNRAETPLLPFEPSTALVVAGPFRFTRNPMYLGMTLMLVGTALLFGSLAPLLSVAVFFFIIRHQYVIPEENMMKELFGDEYLLYCRRVRRWL